MLIGPIHCHYNGLKLWLWSTVISHLGCGSLWWITLWVLTELKDRYCYYNGHQLWKNLEQNLLKVSEYLLLSKQANSFHVTSISIYWTVHNEILSSELITIVNVAIYCIVCLVLKWWSTFCNQILFNLVLTIILQTCLS